MRRGRGQVPEGRQGRWREVEVLARKTLSGLVGGSHKTQKARQGGAAAARPQAPMQRPRLPPPRRSWQQKWAPPLRAPSWLPLFCKGAGRLLGGFLLEEGNQVGALVRLLQPSKHHLGACRLKQEGEGKGGGRGVSRRQRTSV